MEFSVQIIFEKDRCESGAFNLPTKEGEKDSPPKEAHVRIEAS